MASEREHGVDRGSVGFSATARGMWRPIPGIVRCMLTGTLALCQRIDTAVVYGAICSFDLLPPFQWHERWR